MKKLDTIVASLLVLFAISIGIKLYHDTTTSPIDHTNTNVMEVIKFKEKVVHLKDTITRVEYRLKKAKALHDTVTIIKAQDTLIKFLKVEVKLQDTIIKHQDTIIVDCKHELQKEKNKKWLAIGAGIVGVVTVLILK